jgi:hypothetical protein
MLPFLYFHFVTNLSVFKAGDKSVLSHKELKCSDPVNDLTIHNNRGCSNTCNFLFKLHATLRHAITHDEKWNCWSSNRHLCLMFWGQWASMCTWENRPWRYTRVLAPLCLRETRNHGGGRGWRRTTAVLDATPCSLVEVYRRFRGRVNQARDQKSFVCYMLDLSFDPEDGGSIFIRNTGNILPYYTASHQSRYVVLFTITKWISVEWSWSTWDLRFWRWWL